MTTQGPPATEYVDRLCVRIYSDRESMGVDAAETVASWLREAATSGRARVIFASARSQLELLTNLAAADVPWDRVEAFHMDEYIGLSADAEESFSSFLVNSLFSKVSVGAFRIIDGAASPELEAKRYAGLLGEAPIDVVCCGVGENGHIAFNEPGMTDFNDPWMVKEVDLTEMSRDQQVHDGAFKSFDQVPRTALTLTVPALTSAARIACVVPGATKRAAVHAMLRGPIEPSCPASVLRLHPRAVLYVDRAAYDADGVAV